MDVMEKYGEKWLEGFMQTCGELKLDEEGSRELMKFAAFNDLSDSPDFVEGFNEAVGALEKQAGITWGGIKGVGKGLGLIGATIGGMKGYDWATQNLGKGQFERDYSRIMEQYGNDPATAQRLAQSLIREQMNRYLPAAGYGPGAAIRGPGYGGWSPYGYYGGYS